MSKVRVVIENITPQVDCGRFRPSASCGETVVVEADVFTDGHDVVSCALLYRAREATRSGTKSPMTPLGNDRWHRAASCRREMGRYQYTVQAWVDHLATWRLDIAKKQAAGQDVPSTSARQAARAAGLDETSSSSTSRHRRGSGSRARRASPPGTSSFRARRPRSPASTARSRTVEARLPYVAGDGLRRAVSAADPSDRRRLAQRRRTTRSTPEAGDPGSPWAIGGDGRRPQGDPSRARHAGGFPPAGREGAASSASRSRSTSPSRRARIIRTCASIRSGSCKRPDGTIQYAENPPKKYQDIYPFHFEGEAWRELWDELQERRRLLDRAGRAHLPRRQSAHQALRVLGMADRAK